MQYLSREDAERLARPTKFTALQQKCLTSNERLNHLSFSEMFQLVKIETLPKKFPALQDFKPLSEYFLFDKSHRKELENK